MPARIKKILLFVFTIYALLLFVIFTLLAFPLVLLASLFGKISGGNIIYYILRCWSDWMLPLCGIFHKNIFAGNYDYKKQYVFVINHISYLDIPVVLSSLRKQHFRILGKQEMSTIPVFGFIYKKAAILVDRSSPDKRAKSIIHLKEAINKNLSVVIFPEGTFNETNQPLKKMFDGAFRIAIETQTPIKPLLFLDNYDRLNHKNLFSLTPGISRTVYLDEVSVTGLTMIDLPMLKEKVFKIMEEKLLEYKASWIQTNSNVQL
jgi:1-acyl-sn-glycerol-3-phosphate acyltransferase